MHNNFPFKRQNTAPVYPHQQQPNPYLAGGMQPNMNTSYPYQPQQSMNPMGYTQQFGFYPQSTIPNGPQFNMMPQQQQQQPNPQSFNYRNQNWNGYTMNTYRIDAQFIETYAVGIFNYFDKDKSGSLEMGEVPNMINHLFRYLRMPQPSIYDVFYMMFTFDANGDGVLDFGEFKAMLYFLAGKR